MFLATVVVETNGAIPNRDIHVGQPLALIVAQAFAYAIQPTERIRPEAVQVEFNEGAQLEPGVLTAIRIASNADAEQVTSVDQLRQAIASAIDQSAMFRCRSNPGSVRIELCLGVHLTLAHA